MPDAGEADRAGDSLEREEWPPSAARVQSAIWRAEGHIERGEYAHAARALQEVLDLAPPTERELLRGLHHLAAAGRKQRDGRPESARRQLEHARRRLGRRRPRLVALVARELDS